MTAEHWGEIPWQPHAKKRPQVSKGGRRTHQDPKDRAAEDRTRDYLTEALSDWYRLPFTKNVAVRLRFYRATAHIVDLDNLVKHFLDSANKVLFVDDCQVTKISAELHLDRDRPRTEWHVTPHRESTMARDLTTRVGAVVAKVLG